MKILVCTVGGSDVPVVTAVRSQPWDHVLFVCSSDSRTMVTERVAVAAQKPREARAQPAIPVQAGLDVSKWSMLEVPKDDPSAAYAVLTSEIDRLKRAIDGAHITVDYTGGTKSMSVAAAHAAAARANTALQVTTGQRTELLRVVDGTQQAVTLPTERLPLDRQIDLLRAIWRNYGYEEAARGFGTLLPLAQAWPDVLDRMKFWKNLSERFAAWDRYDRKQAASNIAQQRPRLTAALRHFADLAEQMWNGNNPAPSHESPYFGLPSG